MPDGRVDLDDMPERAQGAGLVYLCNPNNPTGSIVSAVALREFIARLADDAERLRQRELNRAGRQAAERFFTGRGLRYYPAEANYLFVDIRRDVSAFRMACEERGLLIGRPYPPAHNWARFTIGSPEEMQGALSVLQTLL